MVPTTTVFIISPHLMFGHGLESLLGRESRLAVIGRETNIEQALEQVKILQPAVVILDSDEFSGHDITSVRRILMVNPAGRVIGLSLRHNKAYTYRITESDVRDPEDLIRLM